MNALKMIGKTFIYVLAGSILSTTLFITLFDPDAELDILLEWQVIAASALCAIGTLMFYSKRELSKKQMRIRQIIHYGYINIIMFGTALICDWIDTGKIIQLIALMLLVAIVYYGVCLVLFQQSEKEAEYINQRLRKIYPEEEKEE